MTHAVPALPPAARGGIPWKTLLVTAAALGAMVYAGFADIAALRPFKVRSRRAGGRQGVRGWGMGCGVALVSGSRLRCRCPMALLAWARAAAWSVCAVTV